MPPYIPKRVIVKKECHLAHRTKLYLANIQRYNPNVEIIYLNDNFQYPAGLDAKGKYEYSKETVIIGERVTDFIRSFPSPGDIVEHFVTVVNTSWMCAYKCEFCYLQATQAHDHTLYTNLHKLDRELESAAFANTAILSIWSMLSFAAKRPFFKIPLNLMETSDWLRNHFVNARINSDEKAIRSLFGKQKMIYEMVGAKSIGIKRDEFCVERDRLVFLYNQNKNFPLWLNTSEFQDSGAVEHLTGSLEHIVQLLPKFKELRFTVRTRSNDLDVLTRYPLFNRVQAVVVIEPQTIIDKYEPGTATLDERIGVLQKLQSVDGLILRIIIEPVFHYPGWDKEFAEMLKTIFSKIDSKRISKVTIGFPRYRLQLKSIIEMHYPQTALFDPDQNLQEPESNLDARLRYTYERRVEMFNWIKGELAKYSIESIALNSETPKLWDMVGFDKTEPINSSVYQYSEQGAVTTQALNPNANPPTPNNGTPNGERMAHSLEYDAAYEFIQNEEEEINDIKFAEAEQLMDGVVSFDEESDEEFKETRWTNMYAIRISEARSGNYTWKPIKLVGFLSEVEPPAPLEINGVNVSLVHISVTDLNNDQIDCLRIPYQLIQPHLEQMRTGRQLFSLLGTIVSVNVSKRKQKQVYRFYVKRLSDTVTAEDMITYRPSQLKSMPVTDYPDRNIGKKTVQIHMDQPFLLISNILNEARKKGYNQNHIIHYVKDKLAEEFKIKGLDGPASQLGMAIEFAVLQSISQGWEDYSYKLHSLLIGPPEVGKGFIPRVASILNPVFDEVPSDSPKLTSAGMVGHVIHQGKKRISSPGVFPLTSGGTVAIQDFHEVRGAKRRELFSIFSGMMEDGEVLDKTSANTVHQALVSLHLDANRYSQVYRDREFNSFEDIDIPMNILSRFDLIMEIPPDAERQREISKAMITAKKLGNRTKARKLEGWAKQLNMIIAFLRKQYSNIFLPEEVADYIRTKLDAAIEPYRGQGEFDTNYQTTQNRISFSVQKLVKAIACANMDVNVTKEHVDYAFKFINEKIRFIASIDAKEAEELAAPDINDRDERKELLAREFHGKEFTAKEARELLVSKMEGEISVKTVGRDLKELGARIVNKKKGTVKLGQSSSKGGPSVGM